MGMMAMTLYSGGCAGNQKQKEEVRVKPYKNTRKSCTYHKAYPHLAGDRPCDTVFLGLCFGLPAIFSVFFRILFLFFFWLLYKLRVNDFFNQHPLYIDIKA